MNSGIFLVCLLVLKLALDLSPIRGYVSYVAYGLICIIAGGVILYTDGNSWVGYFSEIVGIILLVWGVYRRRIEKSIT